MAVNHTSGRIAYARRVLAEALEGRRLMAATPTLVGDIDRTTDLLAPGAAVQMGKYAYFAGRQNAADGPELFRTDGTKAGTVLVKDINPTAGSNPTNLTVVHNTLYFTADDGTHGSELWTSDGTAAGTKMLMDLNPGAAASSPSGLSVVGTTVYFSATDSGDVKRLYETNGTAAGTRPVNLPGTAVGLVQRGPAVQLGSDLLVSAVTTTGTYSTPAALYLVNGSLAKAVPNAPTNVDQLVGFNGAAYFNTASAAGTDGSDLWRTDGTAAGTYRVKAFAAPSGAYDTSTTGSFVVSGDRLYFTVEAYDTDTGYHTDLYRTDGTSAGTTQLTTNGTVQMVGFAVGARSVTFVDTAAATGRELYVSDGTVDGTKLLKDFTPGAASTAAVPVGSYKLASGKVLFTSSSVLDGPVQVWTTDGTASGTKLVTTLSDAPYAIGVQGGLNGVALLQSIGSYGQGDLYRSDGTASGTYRVGATLAANGSSLTRIGTQQFVAVGNTVYFVATDGKTGNELYKTVNGAAAVRVADLIAGGTSSSPTMLTVAADGALYFQAVADLAGERALYRIAPGAAAPTRIVGPVALDGIKIWSQLNAVGNTLLFNGYSTADRSYRIYRYDPTTNKTTLLLSDTSNDSITQIVKTSSAWYFGIGSFDYGGSASTVYHQKLYRLGSPTATPKLVTDITSTSDYELNLLGASGDTLYFTAHTDATGDGVYRTDGTAAGTRLVSGANDGLSFSYLDVLDQTSTLAAGGVFYYPAYSSRDGKEHVYRTDGTSAGTVALSGVTGGTNFVTAGGKIYFIGTGYDASGNSTAAVYRVAGNAALPVTQSATGDVAFRPTGLKAIGNTVFVLGIGGNSALYELWRTDDGFATFGKAATLGSYTSYASQPNFRSPAILAATATDLYFPMYAPATGVEPYRLSLAVPAGTANLSGYAFDDANGDGKIDGSDKYTAGKTIFLDSDNDGVLDPGETSVVTDSIGKFSFTGLAAGTYHVRRVFVSGYTYSTSKIDLSLTTGQSKTGLLIGTKKA